MKKLLVLGLCFFIVGCGSDDKESTPEKNPEIHQFQIGSEIFSAYIPSGWRLMPPPKGSEAVLIAYSRNQNFIILQNTAIDRNNIVQEMIKSAQKNFLVWKNLQHEKGSLEWSFTGKTATAEPLRQYEQKVIPLSNDRHFLLGSCAFETARHDGTTCKEMIQRWNIVTKKE